MTDAKQQAGKGTLQPLVRLVLGRIRLMFGFCPACGSAAPAIYICQVCEYSGRLYSLSLVAKARWWKKFVTMSQRNDCLTCSRKNCNEVYHRDGSCRPNVGAHGGDGRSLP